VRYAPGNRPGVSGPDLMKLLGKWFRNSAYVIAEKAIFPVRLIQNDYIVK
jgi:hypothetical protein